jgi:site-specific DNA recombinase
VLLEEFRRAGCDVLFMQHPISDDPNDQLLLQIQGAVAEYERAALGERFRRGKLQKAHDGRYLNGRAPYGYRYVPRRDEAPSYLLVDEGEAEMVRSLYGWLTDERMTVRQIVKRLNASPYRPRSGRPAWRPAVVHHILADPIYAGTAYANRYRYVPAAKPRRAAAQRSPRTGAATCRRLKPREQWIAIPVPALVDAETWDRAQAQLARNAALSFRHNAKHDYLLRCLLTCEVCGLAMHGITRPATTHLPPRQYYACQGKHYVGAARTSICPSRTIEAKTIERAVWEHIAGLLGEPARLLAQFDRLGAAEAGSPRELAAEQQLRSRLDRMSRADTRLLDAYQAEVLSRAELTERRRQLGKERQDLERQQEERARLRQQRLQAEAVRTDLTAFCSRIRARLDQASFAERQAILQLLIERIIVGNGRLEIRHAIPLHPPPSGSGSPAPPDRLRSDGEHRRGLHAGAVVAVQNRAEGAGVDALGQCRAPDQVGGMLGLVRLVDLEADDLAAVEVEDQEQVEPAPLHLGRQEGHVPAPDLPRAGGHMRAGRAGGPRRARPAPAPHLAMVAQHAMEAGLAGDVDALVGQRRDDPGRRRAGEARLVGKCHDPRPLGLARSMWGPGPDGLRPAVSLDQAVAASPALEGPCIDAGERTGGGETRARGAGLADLGGQGLAAFRAGHASSPSRKTAPSFFASTSKAAVSASALSLRCSSRSSSFTRRRSCRASTALAARGSPRPAIASRFQASSSAG